MEQIENNQISSDDTVKATAKPELENGHGHGQGLGHKKPKLAHKKHQSRKMPKVNSYRHIITYILSTLYIFVAIILSFVLFTWFLPFFPLPGWIVIWPTEVMYVTGFNCVIYSILSFQYSLVGMFSLVGSLQNNVEVLNLAFYIVVSKYTIQFLLLFNIVFLNGFHDNKTDPSVRRASNFFLSFTIFPLLTDLQLMANASDIVRDLHNQSGSKNRKIGSQQSHDSHSEADSNSPVSYPKSL